MATQSGRDAIIAEAPRSFPRPGPPAAGAVLAYQAEPARQFLTQAPWPAIFLGAAMFFAAPSFNPVGDGLRDALDPRRGWGARR